MQINNIIIFVNTIIIPDEKALCISPHVGKHKNRKRRYIIVYFLEADSSDDSGYSSTGKEAQNADI